MRKKQKEHAESGSIGAKIFRYAIMAIVLFISLYPILWVLISSFKEKPGGLGLPEKWVFDGYITIFTKLDIQTYFLNSIIITCVSTLLSVTIVAMAAYVVARMNFKGKGLITLMFSTTLFIPAISISFPIYRLLGELGLRDTRIGVIFIYSSELFHVHTKRNGRSSQGGWMWIFWDFFQNHSPYCKTGTCNSGNHGLFE